MSHQVSRLLVVPLLFLHVHVSSLEHGVSTSRWKVRSAIADQIEQSPQNFRSCIDSRRLRKILLPTLRLKGGLADDSRDRATPHSTEAAGRKDGHLNATAAWNRVVHAVSAHSNVDGNGKPRPLTLSSLVLDSIVASQLLVIVQLLVDLFIAIPVLRLFTAFVLPMVKPAFEDFPNLAELSIVLAHWGIRLAKSALSSMVAGFLVCCIAQTRLAFQHPVIPAVYAASMNLYGTWTFLLQISQDEQFKGHLSLFSISLRVLTCEVPGLVLYMWLVCQACGDNGATDVRQLFSQLLGTEPSSSRAAPHGWERRKSAEGATRWSAWAERTCAWIERVGDRMEQPLKRLVEAARWSGSPEPPPPPTGQRTPRGGPAVREGESRRKAGTGDADRVAASGGGARGQRGGEAEGGGGPRRAAAVRASSRSGEAESEESEQESEEETESEASQGAEEEVVMDASLLRREQMRRAAAAARPPSAQPAGGRDSAPKGPPRASEGRGEGEGGGSGLRRRAASVVKRLSCVGAAGLVLQAGVAVLAAAKRS